LDEWDVPDAEKDEETNNEQVIPPFEKKFFGQVVDKET